MQRTVVAKTIVYDDRARVLVLTRAVDDDIRPGGADLPGGAVEEGEDIAAGAVREILEETGLSLAPHDLRLVYAATEIRADKVVIRCCFAGRVAMPDVRLSHEHSGYQWLRADEAARILDHPVWGAALRLITERGMPQPPA